MGNNIKKQMDDSKKYEYDLRKMAFKMTPKLRTILRRAARDLNRIGFELTSPLMEFELNFAGWTQARNESLLSALLSRDHHPLVCKIDEAAVLYALLLYSEAWSQAEKARQVWAIEERRASFEVVK